MSLPETIFLFVAGLFSSVGERILLVKEIIRHKSQNWSAQDKQRRRRQIRYTIAGLLACLVIGVGLSGWSAYSYYRQRTAGLLAAGRLPSRTGIYAGPRILRVGQSLTHQALESALQRAGYVPDNNGAMLAGSFTVKGETVTVTARPDTDMAAGKTVFRFANSYLESINSEGVVLESFALEPELMGMTETHAERLRLTFNDLPPHLVKALIALPDPHFFTAPRGLSGFWHELRRDEAGLIQRLVNNSQLAPVHPLNQRLATAMAAAALRQQLTAEELLTLYSNEVYLGQRGASALYGVGPAARAYFGKEVSQLTVGESALLAGLAESPWRYAPDKHPDAALARRTGVLAAMLRDGALTPAQASAAVNEPLRLAPETAAPNIAAPYFADYANRLVDAELTNSPPSGENSLRVYTTLDPGVQSLAENLLERRVRNLSKAGGPTPQVALVAMEVQTGRVVALVGGSNYAASSGNRATDVLRPAGAALAPVVYAAALEKGLALTTPLALPTVPATMPVSASTNIPTPMNTPLTLRDGLLESNQAVTMAVAQRAGAATIRQMAQQMALLPAEGSAALDLSGTAATPLALASAYTAFANNGQQTLPDFIDHISSIHYTNIWSPRPPVSVITPAAAYMLTHLLQTIVQPAENPADTATTTHSAAGPSIALAGKPGRAGDGWFIGYSTNLVCAVWVGFDGSDQAGANEIVWPLWQDFMREAVAYNPDWGGENFAKPDNVRLFKVDLTNGLLANRYCEKTAEVALLPDQVPESECREHTKDSLMATVNQPKIPLLLPSGSSRTVSGNAVRTAPLPVNEPASATGTRPPVTVANPSSAVKSPPLTPARTNAGETPAPAVLTTAPPLVLPPTIIRPRATTPR